MAAFAPPQLYQAKMPVKWPPPPAETAAHEALQNGRPHPRAPKPLPGRATELSPQGEHLRQPPTTGATPQGTLKPPQNEKERVAKEAARKQGRQEKRREPPERR